MKRLAENQLVTWASSHRRKPLMIRGARQVGKTWLVENILAKSFHNFVKIDFERQTNLHNCFGSELNPESILARLELTTGRIIPGKTLLFFDEIQACPRAVMALRYFYEELPELHIVAAGSLLEFSFDEIQFPVGRIQYLNLQPLTFYEYLLALNKEVHSEYVLEDPYDTDPSIQQTILEELRHYFFIGGMPECVKAYRDTGSMLEAFQVQSEILESFKDDFSKYRPKVDPACLAAVLIGSAKNVGEQIKYTRLNDSHSSKMNHRALDLLLKARLVNKIHSSNPSGLPLGATANPKKFKTSMLDIGLMQRACQLPVDTEMQQNNLLSIYRGKLAEQFIAQELLAWHSRELFYWSRDARSSSAEVDFLVVKNGIIYPVEVKSGAGGSMKSLHLLLQKYPNCREGIVLYGGPTKKYPDQKLIFLPLYSVNTIADRLFSPA